MKTLASHATLVAVLFATCAAAHAQLVNLHYEGVVRSAEPGLDWFAPGQNFENSRVRVDLTYNPSLLATNDGATDHATYLSEGNSRWDYQENTLRLRFGRVDLEGNFDRIDVNTGGLTVFSRSDSGSDISVSARLQPGSPGFRLPTSLPPDLPSMFVGFLSVHIPDSWSVARGSLTADLNSVMLTRGNEAMTPVPETSTYGLFAAAMLVAPILCRHAWRSSVCRSAPLSSYSASG